MHYHTTTVPPHLLQKTPGPGIRISCTELYSNKYGESDVKDRDGTRSAKGDAASQPQGWEACCKHIVLASTLCGPEESTKLQAGIWDSNSKLSTSICSFSSAVLREKHEKV